MAPFVRRWPRQNSLVFAAHDPCQPRCASRSVNSLGATASARPAGLRANISGSSAESRRGCCSRRVQPRTRARYQHALNVTAPAALCPSSCVPVRTILQLASCFVLALSPKTQLQRRLQDTEYFRAHRGIPKPTRAIQRASWGPNAELPPIFQGCEGSFRFIFL